MYRQNIPSYYICLKKRGSGRLWIVLNKVLDQMDVLWYYIQVAAREQQNENKKYLKKYLTKKNKSDKILFVADATLDP